MSFMPPAGALARFAFATTGCFYACMTGSLVVHEIVGHGLMSLAVGGRFLAFKVTTGFTGWAYVTDYAGPRAWLVSYGGIMTNAVVGLTALALAWRRLPGPAAFALFWLAATETGHALGYFMTGMLFKSGDAASLALAMGPVVRWSASAAAAAALLALGAWSVRRMGIFVERHFLPDSAARRRAALGLGFLLPVTVIVTLTRPGTALAWQTIAFNSTVLAAVAAGCWWWGRRPPRGDYRVAGRPLGWPFAVGSAAVGAAVYLAAALWLTHVVELVPGTGTR